jgi:uncharacterized protein YndB with AHSA1/START domain
MPAPQSSPGLTLQIRRTFAAPREKVFAAWTQREQLEKWMCRDVPAHSVTHHELDVRPGGRYTMEVRDSSNGEVYWGQGTYREVKPPEKLVFSWAWTKDKPGGASLHPDDAETLVTLEFFVRRNATEVVLTHTSFGSTSVRDMTNVGWNGCFDVLEKALRA